MTRVTLVLACVLCFSSQQTFRSGVDVVRVDALVTEGHKPIAGLSAADFELRDNGVVQSVDAAALQSLPLSLIFVLDVSGSVSGENMRHLRDGVDVILDGLRAGDRAGLVTFSHRVWLRTPLIDDLARLRAMMSDAVPGGGTALHDAVYAGLAVSDVQDSRPLLVVFSDGVDTMSWMSADVVEKAARRANAVVYGVTVAASTDFVNVRMPNGVSRLVPRPRYARGQTDFLDALAAATGGRVLKADATSDLPEAFAEIQREFRTRYVITYSPRGVDTPGWHRIELKVKGRSADVKARGGYQK
jgi:VWFA-related protein